MSLCATLLSCDDVAIPVLKTFSKPDRADRTPNWLLHPTDRRRVLKRDSIGSLLNLRVKTKKCSLIKRRQMQATVE